MKKRIGEILIENGTLTQEQLQSALKSQQQESGKLLGKVLIELGYVTEEDIVVALATQFNVPYLPIGNFSLNETVENLIPKDLIAKHICVPVDRIGNLLTVVMADPTNEQAIKEIEEVTKCKVQVFVATATEISTVIQEHFHIRLASGPATNDAASQVSFRSAVIQKTQEKNSHKP
ncbi:MAG: hypothetical protein HY585_02470 [Candidatus Omnitrophica bacterium]|nr:hypothetical protein [Candidatus Omnitrophota bacterium]